MTIRLGDTVMREPGSDRYFTVLAIDASRFAYKPNPRVILQSLQTGRTLKRFRLNSLKQIDVLEEAA